MRTKILLLVDWYEPGYKAGGPIQSCRNFAGAMKDQYDIHIITSDRDQGDIEPYSGIQADKWTERGGIKVYYSSPGSIKSGNLQQLIAALGPDHIYLNSMFSYSFTILPLLLKWRGRMAGNVVLAPRGMLLEGAMKFKPVKKKLFLALLKGTGIVKKLRFQATDEQEKKDILRYFPSAGKVAVVANFPRMEAVQWLPAIKKPGELNCVFISRMAPKKNLLFLLEALKEIRMQMRLQIRLYGEIEDAGYWKKCQDVIERLPADRVVSWEGPIPNDKVITILQQNHIFVLPTLGENFGHAIFESLLAGRPVLISDKTPWLKLEEQQLGYDLPLDPLVFAGAIEKLAAMDQVEYNQWSKNAFEYAKRIRQTDQLKARYRELFS